VVKTTCGRGDGSEANAYIEAVHPRHLNVKEDQLGRNRPEQLDGIGPGRCLADDFNVRNFF